ncbi:MAG: PorT family protein [Bacteroidales bacterium]|nr:PorT family protein [Bacteroidales bacterium]
MILRPPFLQKLQNSRKLGLLALLALCCLSPAKAQHLVGLRGGYSLSGVHFRFYDNYKNIGTPINFSLLYTYYHSLWGVSPYFGIQTGINYAEQGFVKTFASHPDYQEITRYRVVKVPLVSQFHIDFWQMRLLINIGAFAGYRLSATEEYPRDIHQPFGDIIKKDYVFDCYDRRADFGFIGGGGLAFKRLPFEIQVECNYQYSLSMLYQPRKLSNLYYLYTFPHQLIFSVGLFFHLSK